MDITSWKMTTQRLVDELARDREITPAEAVTLLAFVQRGARKLEQIDKRAEGLRKAS